MLIQSRHHDWQATLPPLLQKRIDEDKIFCSDVATL